MSGVELPKEVFERITKEARDYAFDRYSPDADVITNPLHSWWTSAQRHYIAGAKAERLIADAEIIKLKREIHRVRQRTKDFRG